MTQVKSSTKEEGEIKHQKSESKIERQLFEKAQELLSADKKARTEYIKNGVFINHQYKDMIDQEILDLFDQPIGPRMEGLLIFSPTNNGKTTLIKRFIQDYAKDLHGKILYVETPERTTLKEFYAETLNVLGYPVTSTRSTGDLRRKILQGLKEQKVRIIIYDEIHNLLDSRRDHKKDILNGLRSLNNKAEIPIVLVGIETAVTILGEDEQVAERYNPVEVPVWGENDHEFRNLLYTFEANLPLLKASNLYEEEISSRILELSQGKIGRIAKIIRTAAIRAIRNGREQITLGLINSIKFQWTSASENYGTI